MNQSTAAKFAAIYAAANAAKTANTKPAEAPKVSQPEPAAPAPILLSTLAAKPAAPAPEQPKSPMVYFKILWHEGTNEYEGYTFFSWHTVQIAMKKIFDNEKGYPGYTKCKVNVKWTNGKEITDRIDIGLAKGDFNPESETIGQHMSKHTSTMYDGNLLQGDRQTILSFDDMPDITHRKPQPPNDTTAAAPAPETPLHKQPVYAEVYKQLIAATEATPAEPATDEYVNAVYAKFKIGDQIRYISATITATLLEFAPQLCPGLPTVKVRWNDTGKEAAAYLDAMEHAPVKKDTKQFCAPMQFNFGTPTTTETKPGKKALTIEKYSDKSFVVRGEDTKKYKDELYNFGGSFNNWLKNGAGWIFANKHLPTLQKFIK